ncbi:MAG: DUF3102 domain-containing protein [Oscillospiraceae bacterium]|nr:DUF3102 domain-containing protein [Oscillospiraceae bacterium]
MNPHIFPECEGCQDHSYTYDNKYINRLEGSSEAVTRIVVEPQTHYCLAVGGLYHKLIPGHRPLSCTRLSQPTEQEEPPMFTDTTAAVVTGAAITDHRDLGVITAEIHFYKKQAGEAILEIGNRLNEAKEQLQHGEWLEWLEGKIEFSDATAQRFMRLAREYSNPALVTDLGTSKALVLLALPPAEREEFISETHDVGGEEKSVQDMSKRELDRAVRERAEALEAKAAAEAAAAEAHRISEESAAALRAADDRTAQAAAEAERVQAEKQALEAELETLRNAEPVPAEEPDQQTFEAIRKEAAKTAKKEAEEKLKKKIAAADEAKTKAEHDVAAAQAERDHIKLERERAQAAAADRITQLEKQLKVASSESVTIFKTHYENAQGCINSMIGCLMKLEDDPDTRAKLTAALRALCEKTVQALPDPVQEAPYGNESEEESA